MLTSGNEEGRMIEVQSREQLREARNAEDDWTGKMSAKERRKLQNRLHQRAWRRRKVQHSSTPVADYEPQAARADDGQDVLASAFAAATASLVSTKRREVYGSNPSPRRPTFEPLEIAKAESHHGTDFAISPPRHADTHPVPRNLHDLMCLNLDIAPSPNNSPISPSSSLDRKLIPPLLPYLRPDHSQSRSHRCHMLAFAIQFPLSPDHHLITLIQYNVFRAMMTNFAVCGLIASLPIECEIALSLPLLHDPPKKPPATFEWTELQRSVRHHYWIDSVPCPQLRDNLILATTSTPTSTRTSSLSPVSPGPLDVDDLCIDMCGGLYEGFDDCASRGLLVWGDPWLISSWEVSPGFAKKWGYLLSGCSEMFSATNAWREGRGEELLVMEVG